MEGPSDPRLSMGRACRNSKVRIGRTDPEWEDHFAAASLEHPGHTLVLLLLLPLFLLATPGYPPRRAG
eukprot:8504594-Pyramimonas_sp.AAC.1